MVSTSTPKLDSTLFRSAYDQDALDAADEDARDDDYDYHKPPLQLHPIIKALDFTINIHGIRKFKVFSGRKRWQKSVDLSAIAHLAKENAISPPIKSVDFDSWYTHTCQDEVMAKHMGWYYEDDWDESGNRCTKVCSVEACGERPVSVLEFLDAFYESLADICCDFYPEPPEDVFSEFYGWLEQRIDYDGTASFEEPRWEP